MPANKVVWIVGAGLSKPLGGPLLENLFTPFSWELACGRFPGSPYKVVDRAAEAAHWLYNYGRRFKDGILPAWNMWTPPGEDLWAHAEQFLETVDGARGGDAAAYTLRAGDLLNRRYPSQSVRTPTIEELSSAARRLLAAECSGFVTFATKDQERCRPYTRWLQQRLSPDDAILSFNYDRVVEQIAAWIRVEVDQTDPAAPARVEGHVPLLKLHGSVDWRFDPKNRSVHRTPEPEYALTCNADELAIASPGSSKLELSGCLSKLWSLGMKELVTADAVVVLGYRMPQGDAFAREQLFDALRANQQPHLTIHVVLGPFQGDPLTTRLVELLRRATAHRRVGSPAEAPPTCQLRSHPLYGEDFMTSWERQALFV